MKGKINEHGFLFVSRRGVMKSVECPFSMDRDNQAKCGDWCALFGEPTEIVNGAPTHVLGLCSKSGLVFTEFEDERKQEKS